MRNFPPEFEISRRNGAAPVWLLRFTAGGTDYVLCQDAVTIGPWGVTARPWITSWGSMTQGITGTLTDYRVSELTTNLIADPDTTPNLRTRAKSMQLNGISASVYFWYDGCTAAPFEMERYRLRDVDLPDESAVNIQMQDESIRYENYFPGDVLTQERFPYADPDDIGKTLPLVVGSVKKSLTLAADAGAMTSIPSYINAVTTAITVSDGTEIYPGMILQIDDEKISITSVTGNDLVVVRGVNGTLSTTHQRGAILWEVREEFIYIAAGWPVDAIPKAYGRIGQALLDISEICTVWPGGDHPDYPGLAVVSIPGYVTLVQAVEMLIHDGIDVSDLLTVLDGTGALDTTAIVDSIGINNLLAVLDTTGIFDGIDLTNSTAVVDSISIIDNIGIADGLSIVDGKGVSHTFAVTGEKTWIDGIDITDGISVVDGLVITDSKGATHSFAISDGKIWVDGIDVSDTIGVNDLLTILDGTGVSDTIAVSDLIRVSDGVGVSDTIVVNDPAISDAGHAHTGNITDTDIFSGLPILKAQGSGAASISVSSCGSGTTQVIYMVNIAANGAKNITVNVPGGSWSLNTQVGTIWKNVDTTVYITGNSSSGSIRVSVSEWATIGTTGWLELTSAQRQVTKAEPTSANASGVSKAVATKTGSASKTGTVSRTGSATKTGSTTKTGTVSRSGTITKGGTVAKAGTITSSGSISLGGGVSLTGAVDRVGTITKSGTVAKTGTITSSGDITLGGGVTLTGAVDRTGTIAKTGSATKSGTVTLTGDVAKTGTVSPTGGVALSGSIAKTGTVTRTGSVTKTGTVTRSGSVLKTGTVTLTGNSVANTLIGDAILVDIVNNSVTAPADVISAVLGTPCNVIGTFPAGYGFNGQINTSKNALAWCHELARQCRAYFRFILSTPTLIVRPDVLTPVKTINEVRLSNGRMIHGQRLTDINDVINTINLRYDRDWSQGSGSDPYKRTITGTHAESITAYGVRERPELFKFDFVTSDEMAASLTEFYLSWYSWQRWRHTQETYLFEAALEFGDAVTLGFLDGETGEVTEAGFNPGNGRNIDKIQLTVIE